ncbi:MAG TPA: CtsR family transcriptional regulator [Ruminococcaceae bacterium]|nr:CtsR family transcriptional regulator [Oscillospiraceae bacterium]
MNISNHIAQLILDMIEQDGGSAEMKRNDLAQMIGCVPSQINYVISSRFTPEHGYIVESRRGGGGYIRITRANYNTPNAVVMHAVNAIGSAIDERSAKAHIVNLNHASILSVETAKIMLAAVSDSCYREITPQQRDAVRAAILKQMLMQALE